MEVEGSRNGACRVRKWHTHWMHGMHLFMTSGRAPEGGTAPQMRQKKKNDSQQKLPRFVGFSAEQQRHRHFKGCSLSVTLYVVLYQNDATEKQFMGI